MTVGTGRGWLGDSVERWTVAQGMSQASEYCVVVSF